MQFSASRLKSWQECQRKAAFTYVDNLGRGPQNAKASFGNCIHHALEILENTENLDLAINTFIDVWQNPEKLGVTPEVWPKMTTWGGLRERGIQVLKNTADVMKWETRELIATEHKFLVPFGEHTLGGFVDKLESRKNGKGKGILRVIDYKSNSKRPNMAELALDIQFTVYDYASRQPEFWEMIPNGEELFERFKDTPRRNIWFHLWDAKELDAGSRDEEDFGRLYRLCEQVKAATEQNIFFPNIGSACLYCPFTKECGDIHIPTEEELREQEAADI